jgi:hypothetical protein
MRSDEIRGLGKVTAEALAQNVTLVREVHQAVSGRVFGVLGPAALPVCVSHNLIASGVYRVVEEVHRVVPRAVATAVALVRNDDTERFSESQMGTAVLGVLNGIRGDQLAGEGNELVLPMSIVRHGREVVLDPGELATAFDDATTRIAVFVHGLCETDTSWFTSVPSTAEPESAGRESGRTSYGQRMAHDFGYTPVYVRYNTGLHVSDNGRALAQLLTGVVEGWPCPVDEIVLVGHSMGGLVIRSACHQAVCPEDSHAGWVGSVRHVFCLGTPHLGSHVEQGANVVAWTLGRLPETRPFARWLDLRSSGIKDMRFGSCLETDWKDHDPDELLEDHCGDVPFLPTANYYFVAATITSDPHHPMGTLAGDLLVRLSSASGKGGRRVLSFKLGHGRHLGGVHHFHLLNHPAVYEHLRDWLAGDPADAATPEQLREGG